MDGLFSATDVEKVRKPLPMLPDCGACKLDTTCKSPYMKPTGKFRQEILVVAEAPGAEEDDQGVQLVGNSGRELSMALAKCGIDMRKDCKLTNALVCRPPGNKLKKGHQAVNFCRPNLIQTVNRLKPKVIILLGKMAVESLMGWVWKTDIGPVSRWVGHTIPSQQLNAWICPTYHPSYILREKSPVLNDMFHEHLKAAVAKVERPWKKVPDYKKQVELIYSPREAAAAIDDFIIMDRPTAFDYETNMLKPESDRAKIVCCSMSNGKRTIAFPWHGQVVDAMKRFFISDLPKIASNMKFEHRWTWALFEIVVKNWWWCTMLGAHVIDMRGKISSLKFQAFVRLGQPDYNHHIEPYLKPTKQGDSEENRIGEIGLEELLLYCGMDSLLEFHVAMHQRREMGL